MASEESYHTARTGEKGLDLGGLSETQSVLVLSPASSEAAEETCRALLSPGGDDPQQVVMLSLTDGVDGCLDRFTGSPDLDRLQVITARRGPTSTATTSGGDEGTEVVTRRVSDPSDFPRLGIAISEALSGYADQGRTRVCVDSLTAMLQYADRGRVFRFVQVLQDRITGADATAHYHMHPAAHDEQTVETLRQLFDTVVELPTDGVTGPVR